MRKRIALIAPDLYTGGVSRCVETLSMGLSVEEYEQTVILLKEKTVNFKINGECISLAKEGKNWIEKIYVAFKRYIFLRRIMNNQYYDTVISFGMTANILAVLTQKNNKVIITEHNVKSIENSIGKGLWKNIYNYIYNKMIKKTYNKADVIVTVSKYIGKDLVNNYSVDSKLIKTIYNGVDDVSIFEKKNRELSNYEKDIFKNPTILNVGAVSLQKGQWHLIRIIPYLRQYIKNIQLVILGTGDYLKNIQSLCEKMKLDECVHLLGVTSNPYKYMDKADVFVLSSLYEGFPNVLVEALTTGCPIISVDCKSGPRELFSNCDVCQTTGKIDFDDYGVLVPPFDNKDYDMFLNNLSYQEKTMAEAILELLNDDNKLKLYKKKSLLRAKQFTAKKMVDEYKKII